MSDGSYIPLSNRGAVTVTGPDARAFLQGLVTNDVHLLDRQTLVYSCLLTPQGKFMFDFFMSEQGNMITLECEGGERARALMARLNVFKLRSKITLECIENCDVFATDRDDNGTYKDPRHPDLGFRTHSKPRGRDERPFEDWDHRRILLGIPDGSRDLQPEQDTLEDGRIDRLHGVSYTKGCYMGQELTARIHHRGLAKRHLIAIKTPNPISHPLPAHGAEIRHGSTLIGEMRSSCSDVGLALVKDDALSQIAACGFTAIG